MLRESRGGERPWENLGAALFPVLHIPLPPKGPDSRRAR